MTRMGLAVAMLTALIVPARAVAQAPSAPPQPDVTVRTQLDRTAIFVGDRLVYTVELTCRHSTDVLADDLARDKVKLEGLDMIGSETERDAIGDETIRYTVRYTLATYKIDAASLKIAPVSVRYYVRRAGQRPEEAAPAGSVEVPGASVALRSTLPEGEGWHEVRDSRPAAARATIYRILQPLGIALIIIAITPVAFASVAVVNRLRRRRMSEEAQSRRHARREVRALLEAVRAADPATAPARREAFDRLDTLVREHVGDASGISARSLTPQEVADALAARNSRISPDLVRTLLTQCEIARYAPVERLPPADAWRDALAEAEQVLAIR